MPVREAIQTVKRRYHTYRNLASIRTHQTRMQEDMARRYTEYLKDARALFHGPSALPEELSRQVGLFNFNEKDFTAFWTEENHRLAQSMLTKVQAKERQGLPTWDSEHRYTKELYTAFPEIEQLFRGSLGS